jgi:uncharacterized membrane protein
VDAPVMGRDRETAGRDPLVLPGLLLGVGLGGFVDGIVVHQMLQWHHMRSGEGVGGDRSLTTVGGLEANTLADGVFHAGAWLLVLTGVLLLAARRRAARGPGVVMQLTGLLLAGWGGFNIVEGVVDHHVLRIHHVRDDLGGPVGWDIGFLLASVVLAVAGAAIARAGARRIRPEPG